MRSPARTGWSIAVVVGAACFGAGVLPPPAGASAPDTQGWWWTGTDVGGTAVSSPATPPDVPSDGMYIQADAGGSTPLAYAALSYRLPDGASVSGPLKLTVAPGSATTAGASLEACPLRSPDFHAAQGGPGSAAPAYDCSRHATASVSAGGSSFSLDVAGLVAGGTLAVALLPASGLERVVLSKPAEDSLPVSGAAGTGPGSAPITQQAPAPPAADAGPNPGDSVAVPASSAAVPSAPAAGTPGATEPAIPALATAPGEPAGIGAPAPPSSVRPSGGAGTASGGAAPAAGEGAGLSLPSTPSGGSTGDGGQPWAWALMATGVMTAAGLWAAARRTGSGSEGQAGQPVTP